jgi:hypothetical protein
MSNETALVLAAPERKRILRELLAQPDPWPIANRNLYRRIIQSEYMDLTETQLADAIAEDTAKRVLSRMVLSGASIERARQVAEEKASEPLPWEKRRGQRERERRRKVSSGCYGLQWGVSRNHRAGPILHNLRQCLAGSGSRRQGLIAVIVAGRPLIVVARSKPAPSSQRWRMISS